MKKILDKLRNKIIINKKMVTFFAVITIIAIISGSIYMMVLSKNDQSLVKEEMTLFFDNIKNNKLNYFEVIKNTGISNITFIIVIWVLGLSIVGLPIVVVMYFSKIFILGFSLASIIANYKLKGLLIALLYIFPHQLINIIIYGILVIYSVSLSLKLLSTALKKKTLDFKLVMNKYLFILCLSVIVIIITSLLETFLMPNLIKIVQNIFK